MCLFNRKESSQSESRPLAVKEGLKRFQSQVVYPDNY